MPFCNDCQHRVKSMEKHLETPDHKRNTGQTGGRGKGLGGYGPRLPGQTTGAEECPFPGHLVLKRKIRSRGI